MKTLFIFGLLLLSFQLKAQFKTLELKSGSTYRYTQLHFVSDDTLYFKAKTDKLDYKVAVADLHSKFYLPVGKYYHFHSKSQTPENCDGRGHRAHAWRGWCGFFIRY